MTSQKLQGSRKALADALTGVAGSLVSLWTFFPIEVWKTNLQAGSSIQRRFSPRSLYQGCRTKTLHTASSNFCYFFLYSWILSFWQRRYPNAKFRPTTRLLLSAIAAMMNTVITLPLDVISSKHVTQADDVIDEPGKESTKCETLQMDQVWGDISDSISPSSSENFQECFSEFEEEKKDETTISTDLPTNSPLDQSTVSVDFSEAEEGWPSLWKGLAPALLLCSNPSINYTAYDVMKTTLLSQRQRPGTLSMPEAFLVGLFAKFIATIATYPLIRAKVILMVSSEKSMLASLIRSYKEDGVRGLYKGCDWQLLHTVLKSAFMMMVREKITASTHRLIVGDTTANR